MANHTFPLRPGRFSERIADLLDHPNRGVVSGTLVTRAGRHIDRSGTACEKWEKFAGRDVLPFWVADMDLPMPPFVLDAIRQRLKHPVLGYTVAPRPAVEALVDWLERRYSWRVSGEWLVWVGGVVPGFNLAAQAVAEGGSELVLPVPAYPQFFRVAERARLRCVFSPLTRYGDRWVMDFDDLNVKVTQATAAVMFCNPQNPTGRVYEADELRALADLVVASDTVLISDEIHCPLVLDPNRRHIPIASTDAGVAARSITLFAPTKAYNFPGLGGAVAVIPNAGIRERYIEAIAGMSSNVSPLAYAAMGAAFADTSKWLRQRNALLAANGQLLEQAVAELEGVETTHVEATFMAWLDVTALGLADPAAHFEAHGLGLSDGREFGAPGFVRFNFGCAEPLLRRGIARLQRAVSEVPG